MASTIAFTDAIGAATLKNGKATPGDRFANWVPMSQPVGATANRLSDGALTFVTLRVDYAASFEIRGIPIAAVGGVRLVEIADRLRLHLMRGGTCNVSTGDVSSSAYATCGLYPGSTPSLRQSNAALLEYDFSVSLLNLAGSPVAMVCRYA